MAWTKQAPREAGWYWYRTSGKVTQYDYEIISLIEHEHDGRTEAFYLDEGGSHEGEHQPAKERNQFDNGEWWSRSLQAPGQNAQREL